MREAKYPPSFFFLRLLNGAARKRPMTTAVSSNAGRPVSVDPDSLYGSVILSNHASIYRGTEN